MTIAVTDAQRRILRNALGLARAKKPYRNYYVTGPGCDGYVDVLALVKGGLMQLRQTGSLHETYYVTDRGKGVATR